MRNELAQIATDDQTAAEMRESRKVILKHLATVRKDDWCSDLSSIHTLLHYLVDQCSNRNEIQRVIGEVLSKPWKWRAEFVIAMCLKLDRKG